MIVKAPIGSQQKSGLSDDGEVVTLDQGTGGPARWRRTIALLPPSGNTSAPRARGRPGPSGARCSMRSMWPCKLTSPSDINRNGRAQRWAVGSSAPACSQRLYVDPSARTPKALVSSPCCVAYSPAGYSRHSDPSCWAPAAGPLATNRADLSDRPTGSS